MINTTNVIKVGVMPGRITEVAVEVGTSISTVLELAGLNAEGYEIKMDGVTVQTSDVTTSSTQLILLTKQVKGNATVKIGVMPGRINEFALEPTTTYNEALTLAELSADGYEVKADGVKVTDLNQAIGSTQLILLTKQVKGNAERVVKVGVMPGRISEVAVDSDATIGQALEIAGLSADGYEIKADGTPTTVDAKVGSANLILLTKQVKGNILGGVGLGFGMKSARVGDQIDAEAKAGKSIVASAKLVAQQFDFVETQLQQFAQMIGNSDPMAGMQFQNMQQQINNIQTQLVNALNQVDAILSTIDSHTNAIQN